MEIILKNVKLTKEAFVLPVKYGRNTVFSADGSDTATLYKPNSSHSAYDMYICTIVDVSSIVGRYIEITTYESHP